MINKNVIVKIKIPFLHIAHHLEKVNYNYSINWLKKLTKPRLDLTITNNYNACS